MDCAGKIKSIKKEQLPNLLGFAARLIVGLMFIIAGTYQALCSAQFLVFKLSALGLPSFIAYAGAYIMPYLILSLGLMLSCGLFLKSCIIISVSALAFHELVLLLASLFSMPGVDMPIFGLFFNRSLEWEALQCALLILLLHPAISLKSSITLDNLIGKNLLRRLK